MKQNAEALRFLTKCNARQRKAVIHHADNDLIDSLCECALNMLKGHVRLNPKQKKKLSTHKHRMRKLTDKKLARKRKRNILTQNGGFIGALLTPVLTSLVNLLLK
jgi:hypothetical protein